MTLKEAISKFNTEYRNTLPDELKIDWISTLDSVIHKEIILTHRDPSPLTFDNYTSADNDKELIVPDPFSQLYIYYLAMKKDIYLSDISKYNNDLVLYSSAFIDFENYYNRNRLPLKKTSFFNA